jgi:ABC-type uncharacterized transport system substrate-binding protein
VAATPAHVHPHVFAEARLEVDVDPAGTVTALRHVWRFDDVFSSTVLVEFDKNGSEARRVGIAGCRQHGL